VLVDPTELSIAKFILFLRRWMKSETENRTKPAGHNIIIQERLDAFHRQIAVTKTNAFLHLVAPQDDLRRLKRQTTQLIKMRRDPRLVAAFFHVAATRHKSEWERHNEADKS